MLSSDEQIKQLLEWFAVTSQTRKKWSESRRRDHEIWKQWINGESVRRLSDEELKEKFLDYFNKGAGRHPFNAIYRDRIVRDVSKFRSMLLHLLNEKIPLERRFDDVLDGDHRIEGVGKALASSLLMDFDTSKYCVWNNKTDMGFAVLGWKVWERRDSWGIAYSKVLKNLQRIKDLRPDLNLDFMDVDLFLHTIAAEDEGTKIAERLTGEESGAEPIPLQEFAPEFTMEKHLEEFIEANFERIPFGRKLQLYGDPDHPARQYPTSVGSIDLLAIDQETDDFVVIELKKGRTSDYVVGQTLRYMGWIKGNLAKSEQGVRGIIIAKEVDDHLRHALKMLPHVEMCTYEVSFKLNKAQI